MEENALDTTTAVTTIPAAGPRVGSIRDVLDLPAGDVMIRKVRPPDGTNPILGMVKINRAYSCSAADALRLIDCPSPEFEVLPEYHDDIDQRRREAKTTRPDGESITDAPHSTPARQARRGGVTKPGAMDRRSTADEAGKAKGPP